MATPALAPVPAEPRPQVLRPGPRKSRPWRWLGALAVIAAIAGLAPFVLRKPQPKPAAPVTRTAVVRKGTVERSLRLAGVTAASRSALMLAPPMIGSRHRGGGPSHGDFQLILLKLIDPGTRVHKGDVVAEFDRQYMQIRLEDYRSMVVLHQANLKRLRALLAVRRESYNQMIRAAKGKMEKSRLELRRSPVLSANKGESNRLTQEEDTARYAQLQSEAKYVEISEGAAIRRGELDLQVTQLELQRAERSIDRMVVTAPIDGLAVLQTVNRSGELGQLRQGDQLYPGQPYMTIMDTGSMIINAVANQVDAEHLRLGARARVRFDAYPDLELPAHVLAVGAFAASSGWRANYVKNIPVRLQFDNLEARVIPDLSVSADLILQTEQDTPVLPLESVFSEGKSSEQFAYVQTAGSWEKRPLELGLASNTAVAVHAWVREGDHVALERPLP